MHVYGNSIDLSSGVLILVLLRHRLRFTLNIVTALMFCYAVHILGSRVPRFPPQLDGSRVFQSCVFSIPSEMPYYFWATRYSLLVRLSTRYSFN